MFDVEKNWNKFFGPFDMSFPALQGILEDTVSVLVGSSLLIIADERVKIPILIKYEEAIRNHVAGFFNIIIKNIEVYCWANTPSVHIPFAPLNFKYEEYYDLKS